MVSNTRKTIYICMHDAANFGDEPVLKMEMHFQETLSHLELILLRDRLDLWLKHEIKLMKHKAEYSGAYPNG